MMPVTPPKTDSGEDPTDLPDTPELPTGEVGGVLSGLTSGVSTLLGEVDAATGGTTKPLTDTLNTTLAGVTSLLP